MGRNKELKLESNVCVEIKPTKNVTLREYRLLLKGSQE
jgi:hypothetical protein